MSGLINKVKDAMRSDKDTHNDPRSDNYGPHSSNIANTADPRVDQNLGGQHNPTYGGGPAGTTGQYGAPGGAYSQGITTAGPHSSNLANRADPRVDSDLDGGRTLGQGGYGSSTAGHPGSHATSGGYGQSHQAPGYDTTTSGGMGGAYGSTNAGPHNSNLANKLDPRVDSDRDHRNDPDSTYGSTTSGGAYTGTTATGSTNAGPHSSNYANKLDPRVDSDRDHRNDPSSTYGSSTSGGAYTGSTATGSTNAGPHSSNLANKLDPRVDSDRDNRNDPTSRVGGYGGQDNYGVSGSNPAPSSGGYGNTGYGGTTGQHVPHGQHTQHDQFAQPGHHGQYVQHDQYSQPGAGVGGYDNTASSGYGQPGYGAGSQQYGSSATPGSGNTAQTAGPHNSNLLNKLDPRVDSDLDGSKTYGGNQTHR